MENDFGWLKSKKGGLYKKVKGGTMAIFKSKHSNKWKISFHHPNIGLTFLQTYFDTQEQALGYLEKNLPVVND